MDSCGIHGAINGTSAPAGATATLDVLGPATRPYADFLAALGLSRRGNARGLVVTGVVEWLVGGTVTAELEQGQSCTSSAPMPGGAVLLNTSGRRLTATYTALAPRTRCPGPQPGQLQTLAAGGVGRSALGRSARFTLRLSGSGSFGDDGYTVKQRTSLTLTLKRGRVHQQTLAAPA